MRMAALRGISAASVSPARRWRAGGGVALVLLAVALLSALGHWQWQRAEQKEALAAALAEARLRAPGLPSSSHPPAGERVRLTGGWDAARGLLLDNRVLQGRPGYHVYTPLHLDDGRWVLVGRGWLAAQPGRGLPPLPAPTEARAELLGEVRYPPADPYTLASRPAEGVLWQVLDLAAYRQASGLPVADFVVLQQSDVPDGLRREWPPIEGMGAERHRAYALQWYGLAGVVLVGGALLLWRRQA